MVVVEFLLIAFVVGVLMETWLGFLGTFLGLYALYRFTRLSALLAFALSAYWGLLGYHLGAATGELGVGPLFAVVGFVAGVGAHRGGFAQLLVRQTASYGPAAEPITHWDGQPGSPASPATHTDDAAKVIDVEFRVVS